ncbi:MAG TPA: hypothetical protein PKD24_16110 [Pyrinomonadaceae bacterium]|nr:hypothetical protein [Pyrinomonadaceae bacterium]HMP66856.1 hypothetical protein [Pyrinomonadaceae bacterium]
MCGIAGFITANEHEPGREALLGEMCRAIAHRGPDHQGTMVRGRAALGMRRLSIIDIETGQQPIFSEDEHLAIVFNGEIYNYREIRAEPEKWCYRSGTKLDEDIIFGTVEEAQAEAFSWIEDCYNRTRAGRFFCHSRAEFLTTEHLPAYQFIHYRVPYMTRGLRLPHGLLQSCQASFDYRLPKTEHVRRATKNKNPERCQKSTYHRLFLVDHLRPPPATHDLRIDNRSATSVDFPSLVLMIPTSVSVKYEAN